MDWIGWWTTQLDSSQGEASDRNCPAMGKERVGLGGEPALPESWLLIGEDYGAGINSNATVSLSVCMFICMCFQSRSRDSNYSICRISILRLSSEQQVSHGVDRILIEFSTELRSVG